MPGGTPMRESGLGDVFHADEVMAPRALPMTITRTRRLLRVAAQEIGP
jgi:hypothetical protein